MAGVRGLPIATTPPESFYKIENRVGITQLWVLQLNEMLQNLFRSAAPNANRSANNSKNLRQVVHLPLFLLIFLNIFFSQILNDIYGHEASGHGYVELDEISRDINLVYRGPLAVNVPGGKRSVETSRGLQFAHSILPENNVQEPCVTE